MSANNSHKKHFGTADKRFDGGAAGEKGRVYILAAAFHLNRCRRRCRPLARSFTLRSQQCRRLLPAIAWRRRLKCL